MSFFMTINGKRVEAHDGEYVLAVARRAGIQIPTLCEHKAVEAFGACRLCMVEVTKEAWKGWKGLMTACLYPAAADLIIETDSERVRLVRRNVLDLLLARCPDSKLIQRLAAEHGVQQTSFTPRDEPDLCILCGLCTRVCEAYATAAITTYSRGSTKAVGPFAGQPPADCVGCGACALICPTGNIATRRDAQIYSIWQRTFDTAVCAVAENHCLGCGSCEEACPFAVARVVMHVGGKRVATIPPDHCRGCGACVGACPSGAIDQQTYTWRALLDARGGQP
jgi:bidirectional [NiFe] hydrogenase diaphorase subunit